MKVPLGHVSILIFQPSSFILFKNFLVKIYQFDRRGGGFKTLVTQLDSCAVDCLVNSIGSNNSKNYWHSGLQPCLRDATRYFTGDVLEVGSLTTNDCTETDDRIKLSRSGKLQSQQRNFKSAGNFVDLDQFLVCSQTFQSVKRAINQASADEVVPTTGDNRETKSLTIKMTFVNYWLQG